MLLLWLAMALLTSCNNDNTFNKYLSIQKAPLMSDHHVVLGVYKSFFLSLFNSNVFMVDIDTGRLAKTIAGSFTVGDSKGLIVSAELINNDVVIYFADNWVQQWDLDTGKIVREQRFFRDSSSIANCATNITSNLTFCCLLDGNVRRINLMTDRIEAQFPAHSQSCGLRLNGSFVYTAGFDGLAKRFDAFGTPLATYEVSLGYAYILGFENEYLFISYYNIEFDRKFRIVRWNTVTGLSEEFPLAITNLLNPAIASKDFYFGLTYAGSSLDYIQVFKSNLSLAKTNTDGQSASGFRSFALSGDRFFFFPNNTIYELFPLEDGLQRAFFDFLPLNDTTMIVIFNTQFPSSFYSRYLDLQSGVFSEKIEMFGEHTEFQIYENLLLAAVGKAVVAYHLSDLSLAWTSPEIAPERIQFLKHQDGLIYFATANYAGCHNASNFDRVGVLLTLEFGLYGVPAFLDGVYYNNFVLNGVSSYDFSDGRFLKRYGDMPNMVYASRINGDYIYAANADRNIYKYDLINEGLVLVFAGHLGDVKDVIFRGQFMYSCSHDQTIRKWNIDTGESLFTYFGHSEIIRRLQIRNNILYSSTLREIRSWDLSRERPLASYFDKSPLLISLHA
ncbi:hypothetical protein MP638_006541, partial [Amoeboaphelidium occidentale]